MRRYREIWLDALDGVLRPPAVEGDRLLRSERALPLLVRDSLAAGRGRGRGRGKG